MHNLGFKHLYNVEGGITAWKAKGMPIELNRLKKNVTTLNQLIP